MKEKMLLPNEGPEATYAKREQYQSLARWLMFSMVKIRPNIAFSTSVVSRYVKNSSHQHPEAVKTIMRYFKAIQTLGIIYDGDEGGDLIIKGYSGSDWAGDHATRKSTSGFIFMLNREPVSWSS